MGGAIGSRIARLIGYDGGMNRFPEFEIDNEYVLEVRTNNYEAVFGVIWHKIGNNYRERGTVAAYKHPPDAEIWCAHWRAECYIDETSYAYEQLKGIGTQLLAHTSCTEPLYVQMHFSDPTDTASLSFGQVMQDLDE